MEMLSPSEPDGEVDHSLFDQGLDAVRDEEEKCERSLGEKNVSPPTHVSQISDEIENVQQQEAVTTDNDAENEDSCIVTHDKVCQTEPTSRRKKKESREKKKAKKLLKKRQQVTSDSSSDSAETDLGGSSASNSKRSSLEPPSSSIKPSQHSEGVATLTEESEDNGTDVPNISPPRSLVLNDAEVEEQPLQEFEPIIEDEQFNPDFNESASFITASELTDRLVHCPQRRSSRSYPFSVGDRRMDFDSQRLLRALSRKSPQSAAECGLKAGSNICFIRPTHSTVNRRREQKRIEKDNVAFQKRLNSVKATPGLRRSEQLADYLRHAGPLELAPSCTSKPSSRRTPSDFVCATVPSSRKSSISRMTRN